MPNVVLSLKYNILILNDMSGIAHVKTLYIDISKDWRGWGFARNRQVSLTQLINSYFLFEELPSFRLSIITGKQLLTYAFYPFNKFSALHVMIWSTGYWWITIIVRLFWTWSTKYILVLWPLRMSTLTDLTRWRNGLGRLQKWSCYLQEPGFDPTYNQWSFPPVKRFLH